MELLRRSLLKQSELRGLRRASPLYTDAKIIKSQKR